MLKRLSNAAGQSAPSTSAAGTQDAPQEAAATASALSTSPAPAPVTPKSQTVPESRSVQSISTTISLLSTLCRGSPSITHVSNQYSSIYRR